MMRRLGLLLGVLLLLLQAGAADRTAPATFIHTLLAPLRQSRLLLGLMRLCLGAGANHADLGEYQGSLYVPRNR
jgi:hypothetical protein